MVDHNAEGRPPDERDVFTVRLDDAVRRAIDTAIGDAMATEPSIFNPHAIPAVLIYLLAEVIAQAPDDQYKSMAQSVRKLLDKRVRELRADPEFRRITEANRIPFKREMS
jgi:hypothetical protein